MSTERLLAADTNGKTGDKRESEMPSKFKGRRLQLFLVALCLFGGVFFVIYVLHTQPKYNQYGIVKGYKSSHQSRNQGPRTILLWNSFYTDARWTLPRDSLGPSDFMELQCPVVNCELTNKKDFLPKVEMFDAVVFHTAEPFPLLHPIPRRRDASQLYVFALMEPPGETIHVLDDERGFYNLTMTYRLDSDIIWPYMYVEDIEAEIIVAPAVKPTWRKVPSDFTDENLYKIVAGKTKVAAWFVSHCETLSKREEVTRLLQEYVKVDVFGACGPLKCPHNSTKCDAMIDTEYRFYLSFENALCTDYVTEKFYNALERQVLPVVFGGADYTRIAPPHSYINAEDFKSVKELAEYLIYLSDHPKEYVRYFWWRQYYRLIFKSPFCDLCAKLNAPAAKVKVQWYSDIKDWWLGNSCYFEPKILSN